MGYIIFSSLFPNISSISFWKWTVCCDFVAPISNVSFISSTIMFADLNIGKKLIFVRSYLHSLFLPNFIEKYLPHSTV